MRNIIISVILLCSCSLLATPYWDFETHIEARERIETLCESARSRPLEIPAWQVYPRYSYPHELTQLCEFWRYWQLLDPDSAEHGGIIEAESGDLREVIQTDNTQEVVWDWAYYTAHSGDSTYIENMDLAWLYLDKFPAYLEEADTLTCYYRVWNSALGLLLEMGLRNMLGDSSRLPYADSCVNAVLANRLLTDAYPSSSPYDILDGLHALVNGFTAGCLYRYGLDRDRPDLCDTALVIAQTAQNWLDEAPDSHLNYVDWAMSSGTILWGLVNSRFAAFPDSLDDWLAAYGSYIPERAPVPDEYDPFVWDNSWNIWYANGFRAVWAATGDINYYTEYREILDELLAQDIDHDGGIPASAMGPPDEDMTWISAYLLLYAMDWVIDSLPETDVGALNPSVYMPKGYATAEDTVCIIAQAAAFGDGNPADVHFSITLDRGILLDTTVNLTWGEVFPAETLKAVPGFEGDHIIGVSTHLADDEPWNDTAYVEFYATPIRSLSGNVQTSLGEGIGALIYFELIQDDYAIAFDTAYSDSTTGEFDIELPCLTFRAAIEPEFPFWGETVNPLNVFADSMNVLDIVLERADMVIIDDDTGASYEDYYLFAMDSIRTTYWLWNRDSDGVVPVSISGEMRRHTVLWFTGDDSTNTLDSVDIAALKYILEVGGGNILLTGQGFCEDLSGLPEFDSLIRAGWVGGDGGAVLYGVSEDEISDSLGPVMLFGSGSAMNQKHCDKLEPIPPAVGWLQYPDSSFGAIRYEHPVSGGKFVFLGFGLEGVSYPGTSPSYINRVELIDAILKWFDPTYDVAETPLPERMELRAYPNPFNSSVRIGLSGRGLINQTPTVEIYDINGKRVANIPVGVHLCVRPGGEQTRTSAPTNNVVVWRPDKFLPSGIYFAKISGTNRPVKLLLIK